MDFMWVNQELLAIGRFKYWAHGVTWTLDKLKLARFRYRSRDGRDTVSLGPEGVYFSSTRKHDGQQKPRGRGFLGTNLQNLQIYKFAKVT